MNDSVFPPITPINLGPLQTTISKLNKTIKTRNYQEIVWCATLVIEQIVNSDLLGILDIRAYAYAMMGRPESAIRDTQRMIGYVPTELTGYLRKGNIFSLYGQQIQAIEAYDEGLQTVTKDSLMFQRLQTARTVATRRSERRMDLIAKLPSEITHDVFMWLPLATNATCLTVSKLWRQRTLDCPGIWSDTTLDETLTGLQLSSVMPHSAHHVRRLTINSDHISIRGACFQNMRSNCFQNLQSLKITALGTPSLRQHLSAVSIALSRISNTLTELDLDFSANLEGITLADILLACDSATKLKYTTKSSMATMVGNLSMLKKHDSLADLDLTSSSITGLNIKALLQKCQQLRRLIMDGCDETVFRTVEHHAPNLEIFSYNNDQQTTQIPELQGTVAQQPPGLRQIYTNNGGTPVAASIILPLIYRNMETLETILMNIETISNHELQQLYATYPDFKLTKLTRMTFWPYEGIQQLMLRYIRETTTLKYLSMTNVHDITGAIDTVIRLPVVSTFNLHHIRGTTGGSSLIRLFDQYALVSESSEQSLTSVTLRYCTLVTNAVISSLSRIRTLERIWFCSLKTIDAEGLSAFLRSTCEQLTYVKLAEMDSTTDTHMKILSGFNRLSELELGSLPNVTDQGVRAVLDGESCKLCKLVIGKCQQVTESTVEYAKKKVRTVTFLT